MSSTESFDPTMWTSCLFVLLATAKLAHGTTVRQTLTVFNTNGTYNINYFQNKWREANAFVEFTVAAEGNVFVEFGRKPYDNPKPRYQIGIGVNGNSQASFKKIVNGKVQIEFTRNTGNVLEATTGKEFYAMCDPCHRILRVGFLGQRPFLKYEEKYGPLICAHFGFSTGLGTEGWWKIDRRRGYKNQGRDGYNFFLNRLPFDYFMITFEIEGVGPNGYRIALFEQPFNTSDSYEIAIGAGGNSYSAVRRSTDGVDVMSALSPGILRKREFVPFYLKYDRGLIQVGKSGFEPFLTWEDPSPLTPRHFAYYTEGKFRLRI